MVVSVEPPLMLMALGLDWRLNVPEGLLEFHTQAERA
jgi:hypothetical protein